MDAHEAHEGGGTASDERCAAAAGPGMGGELRPGQDAALASEAAAAVGGAMAAQGGPAQAQPAMLVVGLQDESRTADYAATLEATVDARAHNGHDHAGKEAGKGKADADLADLDHALDDVAAAAPPPLPWCKETYVRIMVQAMHELGYHSSAAALEREAGVRLKSDMVTQLQAAVLHGRWQEVDALARRGELGLSERQEARCRFLVKRQEFLQLVERDQVPAAMECLQAHLTPLAHHAGEDKEELHKLARLLVCNDAAELCQAADWPSTDAQRRKQVLAQVHACLPPSCLIPPGRLQTLVSQSLDHQMQSCRRYNRAAEWTNLLQDCHAPRGQDLVPRRTLHLLEHHSDEVWHIEFSHCGGYLASGSKDTTVIIWSFSSLASGRPPAIKHHLKGHSGKRHQGIPPSPTLSPTDPVPRGQIWPTGSVGPGAQGE